jgi:hypothetical protein
MDHVVFISYANEDKKIADAIYDELENSGIGCWISHRDILPSESYPSAIVSAIKTSHLMVIVLSKYSNRSPHVIRELERALNNNIPILPFRIEDIVLSEDIEYIIGSTQWLDASTSPIEAHIPELIKSVKAKLIDIGASAKKVISEKDTILVIKEDINLKAQSIISPTEMIITTPLNIYFSYSVRDVEAFKLPEIATQLEKFDAIKKAYFFHTRSYSYAPKIKNWKSFLEKSHLLIVFSTPNSDKSSTVKKELGAANDMEIPIIPVFKDQIYLPKFLKPRAGVEFDVYNLKNTIIELYNRIVEELGS